MVKVLLLSDDHGYAGKEILHHAGWADEIWHAGDWFTNDLIIALEKTGKQIRAVYGNVDGQEIRAIFPEHLRFTIFGISFWMTHIGGYPGKYNPKIMEELKNYTPDVFICGHSHILKVMRDEKLNNMLVLNPGSCGNHGFHKVRTALRFVVSDTGIKEMAVVEFGGKN